MSISSPLPRPRSDQDRTAPLPGQAVTTPQPRAAGPAGSELEGLPDGSALLVLTRGRHAGSRYLLEGDTTTAGRHTDSDIFLDDVTVSRRHAEFHRVGTKFVLRDAGSFNGTYLNRSPVDTAVLVEGDEVQIGLFRLTFHTARRGARRRETTPGLGPAPVRGTGH